jgi:hypothetical protein
MIIGMTTGRAERGVKLRTLWCYRIVGFIPLAIFMVVYVVTLAHVLATPKWLVYEWLFIAFFILTAHSWFGVNLTETELVVNSFRRRHIPWANIQAITQERFLGGRRVVVWTDQNERIPLRIPIVDFTGIGSANFERQYHVLGQWWLSHRGPWWAPGYRQPPYSH